MSASGGGGLVKSRDFVNLRCWKYVKNSQIIDNYHLNSSVSKISIKSHSSDGDNENSDDSDNESYEAIKNNSEQNIKDFKIVSEKRLVKSASEMLLNDPSNSFTGKKYDYHLSKSLSTNQPLLSDEDDESFLDAETGLQSPTVENIEEHANSVFVSAAMSVEYAAYPPTSKYIRGDNRISCWAMRNIENEPDNCIFEWVMCIDLKGSLPKYVVNAAFTTLMTDYMVHLRSYIHQLNKTDIDPSA